MLVSRRTFGSNLSFMGAVYRSVDVFQHDLDGHGCVELYRSGSRIEDQVAGARLRPVSRPRCGGSGERAGVANGEPALPALPGRGV